MANPRQEPKTKAKKSIRKTETDAGKTVKAKLPPAGPGKRVKAELLQAVKQEVSKNSKQLARALVEKAKAGNSSSASIIFRALDDQIEEEEKSGEQQPNPQDPCHAEVLAKEEPWKGLEEKELRRISAPAQETET